ncbi:MAG: crotonase/enoyl-CoA hydratase family protein [Actinomycetes bacterium]
MSDSVLIEDRGPVRIITINRPEVRNAINRATSEGLAAAMRDLDERADLTVAILTGAGGGFSAGMDLKAFGRGEDPHVEPGGFGGFTQKPPAKPLIAAVEGFALAGGFELALACDLIVAAEDSRFGIPEVSRGLVAAAGGLLRLPVRIPRNVAMEMALTGRPISAVRAHDMGLVNRLAPSGSALDVAIELAGEIIVNGPMALAVSKRVINDSADWPDSEAWVRQHEYVVAIESSADAREGALAFVEKRTPVWTGH